MGIKYQMDNFWRELGASHKNLTELDFGLSGRIFASTEKVCIKAPTVWGEAKVENA
jgi:hypothetical protein